MGFFGNLFGGGNNSNTNYNMTIDQKCRFMTASFESTLCNTIENSLYQSTPQGIASVVIESVIRNKQTEQTIDDMFSVYYLASVCNFLVGVLEPARNELFKYSHTEIFGIMHHSMIIRNAIYIHYEKVAREAVKMLSKHNLSLSIYNFDDFSKDVHYMYETFKKKNGEY